METTNELQDELLKIELWEQEQHDIWFWEKISRVPFKLLDKVTPKFIQDKIGLLIGELANYVQTGGQYLVSRTSMIRYIDDHSSMDVTSLEDVANLPLQEMSALTKKIQKNRTNFATVQGASTGFGGVFTLAADIPLIVGNALKTLQEIALIYGFDPTSKEERIFIVKVLQFASSDVVGKQEILKELSNLDSERPSNMLSQLQGWKEVFYTYRDHYGMKKMLQMVPVAGVLFGAYANRTMIADIAEAGEMLYRKRRILQRLAERTN